MTDTNDQQNDLIASLIAENTDLKDKIFRLEEYIKELSFQFSSSHDKNYDC